jgi:hypothetical protein
MEKKHWCILILFLLVFGTRILFAFQTPHFNDDISYYNIRQINHIKQTLLPIIIDDLSYGGKVLYTPPFFYYSMTALNFIFPIDFIGKIILNLIASSIVVIAYLIASELTKDKLTRFITALTAGFMPIFFSETVNTISLNSFVIPIIFLALYCMMKVMDQEKKYITFFIFLLLILRLTSPNVIFLVFALIVYVLLIFVERLKPTKVETELILFSLFLITWTLFVGFKNAFLNQGLSILWGNIPQEILKKYFETTSVLKAIYLIGIVPFIFGLITLAKSIFSKENKKTYLMISLAVVITLFMWLRLIELNLALMFIGFVLIFLATRAYSDLLSKIKRKNIKFGLSLVLLFVIIITSVLPSLVLSFDKTQQSFTSKEISALNWLRINTNEESVILATLNEGHLITSIANRKNFIDSNFMSVEDIDERLLDTYKVYKATSQTEVITLLEKYDIDYIYFSNRAKEEYNVKNLGYIDDKCFPNVFNNTHVNIYKSLCVIEEK